MAKYTPRYCRSGQRRWGVFRRLLSVGRDVLKKPFQKKAARPQSVIVGRQQNRLFGEFSRTGLLFVLLACVLGAGGWQLRKVLDSSEIFRLTTVSVQGTRMTSKAQILDLGGIEQGLSLLSFDADLAQERISGNPWIDSVEIIRDWPSSLIVRVHEFKPLAMINIEGELGRSLYYVNGQGKIFARVDKGQDLDYPVLTGIESTGKVVGSVLGDRGLAAEAFRFLRLAARGNPIVPLQTISEVNVSPGKGLIVYLVDSPFPIYMGYSDIRTRYYQLVKLLERLYRKKKIEEIKEIRMDYYEDRILVAKVES